MISYTYEVVVNKSSLISLRIMYYFIEELWICLDWYILMNRFDQYEQIRPYIYFHIQIYMHIHIIYILRLLSLSGIRVTSIKIDPYLNVDAGTYSFQCELLLLLMMMTMMISILVMIRMRMIMIIIMIIKMIIIMMMMMMMMTMTMKRWWQWWWWWRWWWWWCWWWWWWWWWWWCILQVCLHSLFFNFYVWWLLMACRNDVTFWTWWDFCSRWWRVSMRYIQWTRVLVVTIYPIWIIAWYWG